MIEISLIKHEDHINDYLNKEKILENTILPHISHKLKNNIINSIHSIDNRYINNNLFKNMSNTVIKVLGYIDHNDTSIDILLSLQKLEKDMVGNKHVFPINYAYVKIIADSDLYNKSLIYYKGIMNRAYSSTVFFHDDNYHYIFIESQKTIRPIFNQVEKILDSTDTKETPLLLQDIITRVKEELSITHLDQFLELGTLILKQKRVTLSLENILALPTLEQYISNMTNDTNNNDNNAVNNAHSHALKLINTSYFNGVINGNLSHNNVFSLDVFNPNPHYGDLIFDYAYYMVSILDNDYEVDYNDYLSKVGGKVYSGLVTAFRFTFLNQEETLEATYKRTLIWMYVIYTLKHSDNDNYSYLESFLKSNVI